MKTLAAIAAIAGLLALAPAASAELFKGTTSQGVTAGVRTDGTGVPSRIQFKKFRAPCRGGGFFRDRGFGFIKPFDAANARRVRDADKLRVLGESAVYRYRSRVRAKLTRPDRWAGVFRIRVEVRDGPSSTICTNRITFGANLVRGKLGPL